MPDFFTFQQGSDTHSLPPPDTSLRYGRFRAFSPTRKRSLGDILSVFHSGPSSAPLDGASSPPARGAGYGTFDLSGFDFEDDEEDAERWWLDRLLISPRRGVVHSYVTKWWKRWAVLILLPAGISIVWCAFPFPTSKSYGWPGGHHNGTRAWAEEPVYAESHSLWEELWSAISSVFDIQVIRRMIDHWFEKLHDALPDDKQRGDGGGKSDSDCGDNCETLNFWFFLVFYYGFYNLVALLMTTKFFNIYSVNWWPDTVGFPVSFTMFNLLPFFVGVLLYETLPAALLHDNITWILLTFSVMACPVFMGALKIFTSHHKRHIGPTRALSDTQLLFSAHPHPISLDGAIATMQRHRRPPRAQRLKSRFCPTLRLPRSYKRFFWFCFALLLSMIAFVLGEAYSELYLRTLPHDSLTTVMFVWTWIVTIHLLDLLTGFLVGNKVGSQPLQWVFKLYFSLTYQTYVRALYARLRSPGQFASLQLMSSSIVVLWSPITMTATFHSLLVALRVNTQSYTEWKKTVGRGFYIRGIAENVSMVAWLGWVVVLHYGWNKEIYPYFSFDDHEGPYTFQLTFWASLVTWACEIVAGCIVRRIMVWAFGFSVTRYAVQDFVNFPEMLPAFVAVSVHVLQNMLFSMVRLKFY